jgi:DNA replication regulator DPB11
MANIVTTVTLRNYIQETAVTNGADFKKDLTKSVTHLIAREANGQKYKFATQWNIKVVSIKWFDESLERGMILDESLYQPLVPFEKQGIGAWSRCISPAPAKQKGPESVSDLRPRKLRRIASAKLGGQNEGIWNDIVGKPFDNIERLGSDDNGQNTVDQYSAKARPAMQDTISFASETTVAGRQEYSNENSRHGGFLQNCNFLVHGFNPKQVCTYAFSIFCNSQRSRWMCYAIIFNSTVLILLILLVKI